jgi:hypothetical protein
MNLKVNEMGKVMFQTLSVDGISVSWKMNKEASLESVALVYSTIRNFIERLRIVEDYERFKNAINSIESSDLFSITGFSCKDGGMFGNIDIVGSDDWYDSDS